MSEIEVHPCANGKLCSAAYDERDNTIIIFSEYGKALGYFELEQLKSKESGK